MLLSRICARLWSLLMVGFCIVAVCGTAQPARDSGSSPKEQASPTPWKSLFNGSDLKGWNSGRPGWSVSEGLLRNTRGQDADWVETTTSIPSGPFSVEIRVKVLDGSRFRLHFTPNFWLGNEGYIRQFGLYGSDLTDVTSVSDQTYVSGQWYTLRVVVDADDLVSYYKNDQLISTAHLKVHRPMHLTIHAGDGWSEGHIAVSAIRLAEKALRPPPRVSITSILTDSFTEGPLAGLWEVKTREAFVGKKGGELAFQPSRSQDSFALMTSREGTLPSGSSWSMEIRFRFPNRGPNEIGLGIRETRNPEKRPLWVSYKENLKQPSLRMGDKERLFSRPEAWHTLLVTNDRGHWEITLDGKPALSGDVPQADYTLCFGSDASGLPDSDWTTLSLKSVRIEYTEGPKPEWIAGL